MLKHYSKIAFRNLKKNASYALINIIGLSIGLACVMIIALHVQQELSFDHAFKNANRIYRITNENLGADARHWAATPPPMGPEINKDLPEIETSARLQKPGPQILSYTSSDGKVQRFEEKEGFFADQDIIKMFDLQFISGNPQDALKETDGIILTEQMARKYFGGENSLGKTIVENEKNLPLKVTGIVKEFSFKTHLKFDYLISMPTIKKFQDDGALSSRGWAGFYTYILLKQNVIPASMGSKMTAFAIRFYKQKGESPSEVIAKRKLHLQPITDIHLHSHLEKEMSANSDITYVYIFSVAAFFILLLAAVNFINISISQSFNREREIGLRKVVGATKPQLIKQFLSESFLTTFLATVLALILFELVIPFYEQFTHTTFQNASLFTFPTLVAIAVLIISIGLIAGFYPAWFISRFNPITSIKNKQEYFSKTIRNGLIVFQFAVSVFMIVGTIVIYRQMNLFHDKNLGFDKEQVVAITIHPQMRGNLFAILDKIKTSTMIKGAALVSNIPGERFGTAPITFPLSVTDQNNTPGGVRAIWADENLLSTLHISLKEGRNFYSQLPEIKSHEFILNRSAIQTFGLMNPVGQKINLDGEEGEIVGVVNDFNFASLHGGIEPLLIDYNPYNSSYILVKVENNKMPQALPQLKNIVNAISPDAVFSFSFIDEKLDQLYSSENKMSAVFKGFTLLSIIISCLGLFGLSAFATKLRTKEIGIRKVLGASHFGITFLLSKEFMQLILIAIAIASPIAYFTMHQWLDGFAYHVGIDWWIFALAGSASAFVAFITLAYYCIKAAIANPVKALRTE